MFLRKKSMGLHNFIKIFCFYARALIYSYVVFKEMAMFIAGIEKMMRRARCDYDKFFI